MRVPRRALVVDDDEGIRWVLSKALERCGVGARACATLSEARDQVRAEVFPIVFLDVRLPDGDGLSLLRELSEHAPAAGTISPRVVVITAQDAMSAALEAMKLGAYDFIAKPFDVAQIVALVDGVFQRISAAGEPRAGSAHRSRSAAGLVGESRKLLEVMKAVGRVAPTDATVLIVGESGTGKELCARAIAQHSPRAAGPFVTVNTAAIPRELLESELYGHERGAFTGATERRVGRFEQATGGTLFLDEIGDMPLDQQVKLLRVLQEKRIERVGGSAWIDVDVRVLAATHVDLQRAVEQRLFREDLYYRLNVVPIRLPALREHPEDIPLLVEHFVEKHAGDATGRRLGFSEGAMALLCAHAWPGNVRELENAIRRAVVLARHDVVSEADLLDMVPTLRQTPAAADGASIDKALRDAIERWIDDSAAKGKLHAEIVRRVEGPLFDAALRRTGGNQLRAAELLGINRNTLRKRVKDRDAGS
jgi:two-component system nitrogen regulation response regulator GlnG